MKIPSRLQSILWSVPIKKIDPNIHKSYLTHQILMFGNFEDIKWLFKIYTDSEIKNIFINRPQKIYTPEAFKFIKDYVLNLKDKNISPQNYLNVIHTES